MILKCYFDGGNQADSTQYDIVTLAAFCGTNDQLKPFEHDWKEALKTNNAPWLHTTDAVSLTKYPFAQRSASALARSCPVVLC
jgi:hypothetical protein